MDAKQLRQQYELEQQRLAEHQAKVVARLTWLEGALAVLDELEKEVPNADTV